MPNRIIKLSDKLAEHGLDAYIVARPPNIRYYAGSIGGSYLIVAPDIDPLLLVSILDENVTRDQARNCHVETYSPAGLLEKFAETLRGSHSTSIGFDELPLAFLNR